MANYYGTARSNYFLVKDPEAFTNEMSRYPVEVITKPLKDERGNQIDTLYGFIDRDEDGGANIWAYYPLDEDGDFGDIQDLDWEEVFKRHLADDWVAVIMECGAEKHRYLGGFAGAYNNKGETKIITLGDIYALATTLGSNIIEAYY